MPQPDLSLKPPVCKKQPMQFKEHEFAPRIDDYFWLKEKENPEVRAYVESENTYFHETLRPLNSLTETFFEQMKALVEKEAIVVPFVMGNYLYGSRIPEGAQYSVYFRIPINEQGEKIGPEQITLDLNELAETSGYLSLHGYSISPDHQWLAYSIDRDGSERDTTYFKNLSSGETLKDVLESTHGELVWSADGSELFYGRLNEQFRPDQIFRRNFKAGISHSQDVLVFQEHDHRYFVNLSKSKDDRFLFIESGSKESSETWFVDANTPCEAFTCIKTRVENLLYDVQSQEGRFLIKTNEGERNYKLFSVLRNEAFPLKSFQTLNLILSGNEKIDLRDVEVFKAGYAVLYGDQSVLKISIFSNQDKKTLELPFEEAVYQVDFMNNHEYELNTLRIMYSSLKTPPETLEYDLSTGAKKLLHRRKIENYNPDLYETKKSFAKSHDGTMVPISILYKKDGSPLPRPTLLSGYGAYGISNDPGFRMTAIHLANLGFVFAIAHVRGGGCLGQRWYDEGKFLKKKNSFLDLIAAGEHLIKSGITQKGELSISGGSAGGMLVGASMNLRPDLFKTVVAQVPFVDVINTMLDETLPLTPTEYDEWGNPNDPIFYKAMREYSPYDNIERKAYPQLYMTCGWNDQRVTYWEPAKFAAKIREYRTDKGLTLLKTNMGAGHGGQSGRFQAIHEYAEMHAFLYSMHFN